MAFGSIIHKKAEVNCHINPELKVTQFFFLWLPHKLGTTAISISVFNCNKLFLWERRNVILQDKIHKTKQQTSRKVIMHVTWNNTVKTNTSHLDKHNRFKRRQTVDTFNNSQFLI